MAAKNWRPSGAEMRTKGDPSEWSNTFLTIRNPPGPTINPYLQCVRPKGTVAAEWRERKIIVYFAKRPINDPPPLAKGKRNKKLCPNFPKKNLATFLVKAETCNNLFLITSSSHKKSKQQRRFMSRTFYHHSIDAKKQTRLFSWHWIPNSATKCIWNASIVKKTYE